MRVNLVLPQFASPEGETGGRIVEIACKRETIGEAVATTLQNNKLLRIDEAARLDTLRQYQVLDTGAVEAYDELTRLASFVCSTPMAWISLLDRDCPWIKARLGLAAAVAPRDDVFCADAVLRQQLLVVEDAATDARYADHPLVLADPYIRFFAGAPLITPAGHALGTLCVMDHKPRQLSSEQLTALQALADQVMRLLEWHRIGHLLAEGNLTIHTLRCLLPMCSWCKGIRDDAGNWLRVEDYLQNCVGVTTTHGICPTCLQRQLQGLSQTPPTGSSLQEQTNNPSE